MFQFKIYHYETLKRVQRDGIINILQNINKQYIINRIQISMLVKFVYSSSRWNELAKFSVFILYNLRSKAPSNSKKAAFSKPNCCAT